jgi:hypothetical protein
MLQLYKYSYIYVIIVYDNVKILVFFNFIIKINEILVIPTLIIYDYINNNN